MDEKKHLVFIFSDTGGGHRSAVEAIIEAFELEFPGRFSYELIDFFRDYTPIPFNFAPNIYPTLTQFPTLWSFSYHASNGRRRTRANYRTFWPYIRRSMHRLLREHPGDLIISVHQLSNSLIASAKKDRDGVKFATVVTDLVSTHAAWYNPKADLIIVPTEAARKSALSQKIDDRKIKVIGQPVAERYVNPICDRDSLRQQLGWSTDSPVILLVGGGEGMGPLKENVLAIDAAGLNAEMVVIAGRNKKLKTSLEKYPWKMKTHVYGFVREMPEFMRAVDVLVTKAGPGTISEAFIAGLPIILFSRLPGQEDGNVNYVVEHGAGIWAPTPEIVVDTLKKWINFPDERIKVAQFAEELATPLATRQIAQALAKLVGVSKEEPTHIEV